jgi:hypothetical protein
MYLRFSWHEDNESGGFEQHEAPQALIDLLTEDKVKGAKGKVDVDVPPVCYWYLII